MGMRLRIWLTALTLLSATSAIADDLVVLSAGAVRPALLQLPAMIEKETSQKVQVSFGNATDIQTRVAQGAKADLVILPPRQLQVLIDQHHLDGTTRFDLGFVRLGLATLKGSPTTVPQTADDVKAALLAAPSFGMPDPALGSTSSAFLVKLFNQLGVSDAMKQKTRFFKEGIEALNAISRGELTLTIAPITSIRMTSGVQLVGPLPEALQEKTTYAAALTVRSARTDAARALIAKLRSSEFGSVMRERGIDPP